MLDAGPHIHGGSAQLDFGWNHVQLVVYIYGYTDDQMQAAVSALFGKGDIVVFLDQFQLRGAAQEIGKAIDVLRAAKNHTEAGDILQRSMGAGGSYRQMLLEQLAADGRWSLEPDGDGAYLVNRIHLSADVAENCKSRFYGTLVWKEEMGREYGFVCDQMIVCCLLQAGSSSHKHSPRISEIKIILYRLYDMQRMDIKNESGKADG